MYTQFFRLKQAPFSIAPDPRYLFMSDRHREALAHLLYGAGSGGGIVLLTGEIGAGKTTVCRCFLEQIPAHCNVGYIFNPKLTVNELLHAICEEFHIPLPADARNASVKDYIDALNAFLLAAHAEGRNSVLVIDEAQNLSADVLEQLRLLTNLETNERKLLQIILIGQPELRSMLARPELEQLAQRVIARYHLDSLAEHETAGYIQHRLATAGLQTASPFPPALAKQVHKLTRGVPRRINLLCDRALLGAYASGMQQVNRRIVGKAAKELFTDAGVVKSPRGRYAVIGLLAGALVFGTAAWTMRGQPGLNAMHGLFGNGTATGDGMKKASRVAAAPAAALPAARAPDAEHKATSDTSELFSEKDGTSRLGLHSENAALRQLASLWGAAIPEGDACALAAKDGLRCYRGNEGFAQLRQLDRPAVVRLHDRSGTDYYALLTGLSDTTATLRVGDATQTVKLVALSRYLQDEFMTMWRAPRGFIDSVKNGESGPEVDWIAEQLAKLNGEQEPASSEKRTFDKKMQKQIREFQNAQGLYVDGVAGPVTLMRLNRVAGLDEPQLRGTLAAQHAKNKGGE
jgi:general secretion pathway protein A